MFTQSNKITVVKKASDVITTTRDGMGFFADWHNNGFWHASTGENFGPWLHDMGLQLLSLSDCLVFVGVVLIFLWIAGSKRAGKWLWWDFIIYFVANAIKVYMG